MPLHSHLIYLSSTRCKHSPRTQALTHTLTHWCRWWSCLAKYLRNVEWPTWPAGWLTAAQLIAKGVENQYAVLCDGNLYNWLLNKHAGLTRKLGQYAQKVYAAQQIMQMHLTGCRAACLAVWLVGWLDTEKLCASSVHCLMAQYGQLNGPST